MVRTIFISLRTRFLLIFTGLFLAAFAGVWWWTYTAMVDQAVADMRTELSTVANAVALGIDGEMHTRVYRAGTLPADGETPVSPEYATIADFLRSFVIANPDLAGAYTFVASPDRPGKINWGVTANRATPTPYAASVKNSAPKLCSDTAAPIVLGAPYGEAWFAWALPQNLTGPVAASEIIHDEWGDWLTGYAPIRDSAGTVVAAVGVDMCAREVVATRAQIGRQMAAGFLTALLVLILVVPWVTYRITRPVVVLASAAGQVAQGDYGQSLTGLVGGRLRDEISLLSETFELMVSKVRTREQSLKQQVSDLMIIIDESKSQREVHEITDTDFFRDLQQRADTLRARRSRSEPDA